MNVDLLTVSSKRQIVLPIEIRKALSIESGDKLAVYASDDVIMLKAIKMPTAEEFKIKLKQASKWAKEVGYKEEDINDIIKSVRKNKKK